MPYLYILYANVQLARITDLKLCSQPVMILSHYVSVVGQRYNYNIMNISLKDNYQKSRRIRILYTIVMRSRHGLVRQFLLLTNPIQGLNQRKNASKGVQERKKGRVRANDSCLNTPSCRSVGPFLLFSRLLHELDYS